MPSHTPHPRDAPRVRDMPLDHQAASHRLTAVHDLDGRPAGQDAVVVEEPLDIRVAGADGPGQTVAVTMRTPGDDLALALGLCWSEGLVKDPEDVLDVAWCTEAADPERGSVATLEDGPTPTHNTVTVRLRHAPDDLNHLTRHLVMSSACGVCGRTTLDDLHARGVTPVAPGTRVTRELLAGLPSRLRDAQVVFGATGGLHAVARFTLDGELVDLSEDVGRHNAFDKLVGRAVRRRSVPFADQVVLLSGRASYELLAKAAVVGVPVVAAIGAPSSLAVDVAHDFGITLIGFLRDGRGNVHTHPERVHSVVVAR